MRRSSCERCQAERAADRDPRAWGILGAGRLDRDEWNRERWAEARPAQPGGPFVSARIGTGVRPRLPVVVHLLDDDEELITGFRAVPVELLPVPRHLRWPLLVRARTLRGSSRDRRGARGGSGGSWRRRRRGCTSASTTRWTGGSWPGRRRLRQRPDRPGAGPNSRTRPEGSRQRGRRPRNRRVGRVAIPRPNPDHRGRPFP